MAFCISLPIVDNGAGRIAETVSCAILGILEKRRACNSLRPCG
jgi:hypothetical protein